jgi:hypothetical protein
MPGFNIGDTTDAGSPRATVETRRRHRWRFTTLDPILNEILIYAVRADRPRPVTEKITIHHGQDQIYIPGKNRWEPIDVAFYEIENPDAADKLLSWYKKVINLPTAEINNSFKSQGKLEMLNGQGQATWEATLYNCWPVQITWDPLDYQQSDICVITATVSYDKALVQSTPS